MRLGSVFVIVVIIILVFFSVQITLRSLERELTGQQFVSKVIDGDTIVVKGESVRLLGMDADERGRKCYDEAKQRLEELILNKQVFLEADSEDRDQYKRYLRFVFVNETNINLQLVKEGLAIARYYPENQKYKSEIVEAEAYAREQELGCKWS